MPEGFCSLAEIGEEIRRNRVTTAWLTSGLFAAMVEQQLDSLAGLKQLLTGGDVVSPAHARRFLDAAPHARLINGYGPTEGTTFTCCYTIPPSHPAGEAIPIGSPISNTRVHILDERMRPLPPGATGEICIAGDGVARGYLNQPDLTAEKFVADPFSAEPGARMYRSGDLGRWRSDGNIEFLGRADGQVKLRGFRIEPAEIEEALKTHPAVAQAAVIATGRAGAEKQLIAFVVPAAGAHTPEDALRTFLAARLPSYMVPARIVTLDSLPLTDNGKIDRRALEATLAVRAGAPADGRSMRFVFVRTPTDDELPQAQRLRPGQNLAWTTLASDSVFVVPLHDTPDPLDAPSDTSQSNRELQP